MRKSRLQVFGSTILGMSAAMNWLVLCACSAQELTKRPSVAEIARPAAESSFDATQEFQKAFREIGIAGGSIKLITPGTYFISGPISFDNKTSIRIECGAGASRAAADNQTINIVYTGEQGSLFIAHGARSLEIDHCNIGYSNPKFHGDLIDLSYDKTAANTTEVYIHDNRIGGLSKAGAGANSLIRLEYSNHIVIERNMLMNAVTAVLGPSDSIIAANLISIRNNYFSGGFSDVAIRAGGSGWTVEQNVFEPKAPDTCGALDSTAAGIRGLSFRGNWLGDGHSGTCIAASRGPIRGAEISGNVIEGGAVGIALGKSSGISITGNSFSILKTAVDASAAADTNIIANDFQSIPVSSRVVQRNQ